MLKVQRCFTMINIESYRAIIGLFISHRESGRQMDSKERNKNRDNKDTAGVHVFKVTFLVLFGLSFIYCITDPSIEMNPGPSPKTFKSFPHDSEKEKHLFCSIRNINTEINAIQSHGGSLRKCRDNNVTPRGLKTKNKFSLPIKNADNFIKSTLSQIEDKNINQKIEATIQHFDKELSELILQKQSLMSDLEGFSASE